MIADLLIYVATELGTVNYNFYQTDSIYRERIIFLNLSFFGR